MRKFSKSKRRHRHVSWCHATEDEVPTPSFTSPPVPKFIGERRFHSPQFVTHSHIQRLSSPHHLHCQHAGWNALSTWVFQAGSIASAFPPVSGQGSYFPLQIGPIDIMFLLTNPELLDPAPVAPLLSRPGTKSRVLWAMGIQPLVSQYPDHEYDRLAGPIPVQCGTGSIRHSPTRHGDKCASRDLWQHPPDTNWHWHRTTTIPVATAV